MPREIIMAQTIVSIFPNVDFANSAIQALMNNGVPRDDISVLTRQHALDEAATTQESTSPRADATAGTAIGGGLGLLAGLSAFAIPGIGPVVGVGTLATVLGMGVVGATAGAAAGGLIAALTEAGVPEEHANVYAESVRRGGTLVAVTTDAILGSAVYDIMRQHGALDIDVQHNALRQTGWERFDPHNDPPLDPSASGQPTNEWAASSKVGTAAGMTTGAVTGAAIGSVAGPVGTIVGGLVGGIVGGGVGAAADVAGKEAENLDDAPDENQR
jgi:hypothetical protein